MYMFLAIWQDIKKKNIDDIHLYISCNTAGRGGATASRLRGQGPLPGEEPDHRDPRARLPQGHPAATDSGRERTHPPYGEPSRFSC